MLTVNFMVIMLGSGRMLAVHNPFSTYEGDPHIPSSSEVIHNCFFLTYGYSRVIREKRALRSKITVFFAILSSSSKTKCFELQLLRI
jgi:hypothetical protein